MAYLSRLSMRGCRRDRFRATVESAVFFARWTGFAAFYLRGSLAQDGGEAWYAPTSAFANYSFGERQDRVDDAVNPLAPASQ